MNKPQAGAARPRTYYSGTMREDTAYPKLQDHIEADVVIIGGGFTGVATAVELSERGFKVALVESNKIGWGASGRNGGQVTGSLSGDEAMRKQMRKTLGEAADDFVWNLRWRGHEIIQSRVEKYGIECDLRHGHIQAAMTPAHMRELEETYAEAQRRGMGAYVTLLDEPGVKQHLKTDIYIGGLKNTRNMHLHSLDLCIGEARAAAGLGAQIFENTEVVEIVHGPRPAVITAEGRIDAHHVLLAGNGYHRLEQHSLVSQIFPAIGAVVATEPLGALDKELNPEGLAVYDSRFVLDYYRPTADGRLLFGGGANYSGRGVRDADAELRPAIEATFPQLKGVKIDYEWTCAMGIVLNRIPQLGKLSPNVWYAQGYSGHGIATTHIVAEVMAEALTGTLERFDAFANCSHMRVPFGRALGSPLMGIGMWYYQLLEKLR
ncbi:FAD-binding oxidoreductase [Methyloligella sp. GL2]|nr:FAD-binding oxidoreductase [Methyloligella sp. GL2]